MMSCKLLAFLYRFCILMLASDRVLILVLGPVPADPLQFRFSCRGTMQNLPYNSLTPAVVLAELLHRQSKPLTACCALIPCFLTFRRPIRCSNKRMLLCPSRQVFTTASQVKRLNSYSIVSLYLSFTDLLSSDKVGAATRDTTSPDVPAYVALLKDTAAGNK